MGDEVKVGIVVEDKTGPGIASAKRNIEGLGKGAASAASGFSTMEKAIVGVGAAAAGLTAAAGFGVLKMAQGALQSYASYERLGQSINALTAKQALLSGSASTMTQALAQTKTQSKELLGWIEKLAIESPFRQDDVANAFRLAMALGFNTKEAQRLTAAMLNFATATGASGPAIEQINRALGQMRTKGKVSLEEVNQLTEAGVDVMRILADATGKTGQALYKDIEKGAVSADVAINAIISDTEKLYAGAGAASAGTFAGMLSSLEEVQDIVGRTLFTGMFEQLAGPMAALTSIVTAPEFKAGLESWSATLGSFTGDQLEAAAGAMERIDAAISPLLNAGAPAWMTILQGILAAGGSEFDITITPKIMSLTPPGGGWTLNVAATATSIVAATGEFLSIDTIAKSITLGPGVGLPELEIKANITPENQKIIDKILAAGEKGGAKGLGTELGNQARIELLSEAAQVGDLAATWASTIKSNLDSEFKAWEPVVGVVGSWIGDTPNKLFTQAQAPFKEPLMVTASWIEGALGGLLSKVQGWFDTNPIRLFFNPPKIGTGNPYVPPPRNGTYTDPVSGGQMPITPFINVYAGPSGDAIGDGFFGGGLALVGEAGPELAVLPRGTAIYSNRDTRAMGIPGFAAGTTQLPPGAGPFIALLRAAGLWKSTGGGAAMGPKTQADSVGWRDFTNQGTQAMQTAADRTGAAFEETAAKVNKTFESALQSVPGLFGTSQVTADDMKKSKLGLYQPKADEYLRQLSDEVMNGKDWGAGVDIKDAAKRAGIDPNLPNDIILELVKEAWNNSSLFAEGKNLDLINTDAVKAAIEQQQKELSGQASLKALFGITDENLQAQSEALGQGLAAVFGGASETDTVKGAGTALFAKTMAGFSDPATAAAGVKGMADSIVTATGTPENQTALYDAGEAGYSAYYHGWNAAANAAPIVPPGGGTGGTGTTTPPGKAVGVGFWQGGWMQVHANETLYAPRGTTVRNARESARGGGTTIVNHVTINRQIDEAALLARLARQVRRAS